jgi:hypothetical protein
MPLSRRDEYGCVCDLPSTRGSPNLDAREMGHPQFDNATPYACDYFFARDEDGRWLVVVLVQASFEIASADSLVLAREQTAPEIAGKLWGDDPAVASYRIEPAFAFAKVATDVVLLGHAQARRPTPELEVTFRVGTVGKSLKVFGDRTWVRSANTIYATRPTPFERVPLSYERAYGGWDRSHADPARHACDMRNPVGTGFRLPDAPFEEGVRLPNVEDAYEPLLRYGQQGTPAGVGFTSPHWQPRAALAGTFDATWSAERAPCLPKNFDRKFFSGASEGLIAPSYLAGNELVAVENASPLGRLGFRLPGVAAPLCRIQRKALPDAHPALAFDTLVVDTDGDRVLMLYRGSAPLRDGPHDVVSIEVRDAPRSVSGSMRSPAVL